jgi:HlyD family secretion protein
LPLSPAEADAAVSVPDHENGSAAGNGAPERNGADPVTTLVRPPRKARSRRKRRIDRLVMEFQPDAVEMEHRKVAGGLRWTLYTVVLLLVGGIVWASWAEVDRIVVAEGKLIATETFVIQPPSTSPIRSFNVKFGDTVRSGDVLVTLDPTFSEADVAKLEAQLNGVQAAITRLMAEQAGIEFSVAGHEDDPVWQTEHLLSLNRAAELDAKLQEFAAEKRKLDATRNKHVADVAELTSRLERRQELLDTITRLEGRGSGTRTEVLSNEIEVGFVKNQLVNAENSILETDAEIQLLAKREQAFLSNRRAEVSAQLAEMRQQNAGLEEELNKARRANELVVLPVPEHPLYDEFVVVEVAERGVGSVVQPGDPLVRLVPVDQVREVECKVASQDIARIRETDDGKPRDVRIKLSAFPYMKHGTLEGNVQTISEDAFEEGQPPFVKSYYKVRINITDYTLKDVPDNHRLIPGMTATVEIKVGTRRVIDYFLYPLFRSLDSSIREP